ncbi:CCA tRNA nucleotidyltransferase [uncultured Tateyamaria sp.]|uniref:CCA tRNA nucleotidyltransferase n=1 Tax=Tateyamaria sp. 1078 TaxID=3417464 RepID=UPI00261AEC5F|nr:CCA tRNA nucleotidyltransferase [uncultured Tateyamaria sp.]
MCGLLEDAGHCAYFVGGCVRNAVMGVAASDVDIATDASPDDVMHIAEEGGVRAVPTGLDHGTVTLVIDGTPYEVTTFRRDVDTDGRRAVVVFSTRMDDDARRRDFTMNALYADRHGWVHDPVGGLRDAQARRVRFIDDPVQRIREDYLRALRFFRFSAWYADPDLGWDADALAAIAETLDGLHTLSAERVGAETLKLLSAPNPAPAVSVMARVGVLARLIPGADDTMIGPVVHMGDAVPADPITRLAALGGQDVGDRLRLSRNQQKQLDAVRSLSGSTRGFRALGYLAGVAAAQGAAILRAATMHTPLPGGWQDEIATGADTKFPVTAADFPDLQGPALGQRLKALKQDWLASDLSLTKEALLGG